MVEPSVRETRVHRVDGTRESFADDFVAVEEPLAIRVRDAAGSEKTLSITMRTPGCDRDLAVGFLFTEGLITSPNDIGDVRVEDNEATVDLRTTRGLELATLDRHFYTTSSCGVCGKTSMDAVRTSSHFPIGPGPMFAPNVVHRLPETLRGAQSIFESTGGLHAAALVDNEGRIFALREDVGRHNAVDKLIGAQLLAGAIPLASFAVMVSGRASFELVQKVRMAAVPILIAVGAPSSLAIELARTEGMTVLGFVRDGRFNVYCGDERLLTSPR
jgi:FdhD protein